MSVITTPVKIVKIPIAALAVLVSLSLIMASGCGSLGNLGRKTVDPKFYPQCYEPIGKLREDSDRLKKNVGLGALGGAATGAVVGVATTGSARGAVIGAAAGAVVGAGVTYIVSSELQKKERSERFQAYNDTLDAEYKSLDQAVIAGNFAAKCYSDSYKKLSADYKRGRIDRAEMLARLAEIRDGSAVAKEILTNYKQDSAEKIQTFDEIVKTEQTRQDDKPTKKQLSSLASKKNNYEKRSREVDKTLAQVSATFDSVERDIDMIEKAQAPGPCRAALDAPLPSIES
jgi:hypothetical protein